MVNSIYRATRPQVPSIFAAGHEHSLQVHRDAIGAYYLVSGSGSKNDRVEPIETAMMAEASNGYMRVNLHEDGALGLLSKPYPLVTLSQAVARAIQA